MASKKIGLDEFKKMIRKHLKENQETHIAGIEENPKITITLEYDERRPKKGQERYSVNYQLTTPEGQEIEIEGMLKPYHTGRDYEYEFEPGWFAEDADSEYHDEHWEEIEEQILKKFYQTDKFEIRENEEGGGVERVYLNRGLSDYFQVPYTKNDGQETIINSGTLKAKGMTNGGGWDKEHLALFDKYAGMDLTLKGTGFGWWKVIQALRENKNTNMNIRKLIRKTLEENYVIKEEFNVGDTVTNNNNFYKVISEPFTATDNGAAQYAADNDGASLPSDIDYRSFYTAIKVKNIDTGNESKGDISWFTKINPEEIEGLKQAKSAQDAADKIQKEKDKIESDARWAKHRAEMEEKERERISSKGDIELAKKMVSDWGNIVVEYGYYINSHNELEVDCILDLDDNLYNDYTVEFAINYDVNYSGDPEWPDAEIEFTLDLVNIYKGKDLVYKGIAEFLPAFDKEIKPWLEDNKGLHEKADEVYSDWAKSY